ncbi:MAG: hypothetical protein NTW78_11450 [Campylobacterales bacterium]|nr:hypothetical protein [Campylobacterales bacterium]
MINTIKKMRKMATSENVLNFTAVIKKIKDAEILKEIIGLDNNKFKSYEKLERIGYKLAVKKAKTPEELEKCAVTVEENYCGNDDPDEWAEQIRIKAYGIEWYLSKFFNSPQYEEFVMFTNAEEIKNPFECFLK